MDEILKQIAKFIDQISKYIDQIVTLLAVLLGGMITYLTTSVTEKKKEERKLKRQKLDEILIPYCTCIEQLILEIKKIYDSSISITDNDFSSWLARLNEPLEYLSAVKRVYLSQKLRDELEQYEMRVDEFNNALSDDYHMFRREYDAYIGKIAENFPSAPLAMDTHIRLRESVHVKVKKMILSQRNSSLINDIDEVCYVMNDEPENYKSLKFYIK